MERVISASEAELYFSEILCEVSEGESFTVMSRRRSVTRVLPIECESGTGSVEQLLTFISTLPIRHSGNWSRDDFYE